MIVSWSILSWRFLLNWKTLKGIKLIKTHTWEHISVLAEIYNYHRIHKPWSCIHHTEYTEPWQLDLTSPLHCHHYLSSLWSWVCSTSSQSCQTRRAGAGQWRTGEDCPLCETQQCSAHPGSDPQRCWWGRGHSSWWWGARGWTSLLPSDHTIPETWIFNVNKLEISIIVCQPIRGEHYLTIHWLYLLECGQHEDRGLAHPRLGLAQNIHTQHRLHNMVKLD